MKAREMDEYLVRWSLEANIRREMFVYSEHFPYYRVRNGRRWPVVPPFMQESMHRRLLQLGYRVVSSDGPSLAALS